MSQRFDAVRSRMELSWTPLLGQRLAHRRAEQRLRQLIWMLNLVAINAGISVVLSPFVPATQNGPTQVAGLILILAGSYAIPLCIFFTWKVGGEIRSALAGQGLSVSRRPPLHSRAAFTKWVTREHLDQNQLVHALQASAR